MCGTVPSSEWSEKPSHVLRMSLHLILGRWKFGWPYMNILSCSCFQMSNFCFLGSDLKGCFLIDVLVPARADLAGIELELSQFI